MEFMNNETMSSLDFQYILDKINVKTPYGLMYKKKMKAFLPGEEESLREELDRIDRLLPFLDDGFINSIHTVFCSIKDIRNTIQRAMKGMILSEVELFEIKSFLFSVRDLEAILAERKIEDYDIKAVRELEKSLDPDNTGICTFYIYDSYSDELRNIRQEIRNIEGDIKKARKAAKEKVEEDINIRINPDGTVTVPKENINLVDKLKNHPYLSYISENYLYIKYSIRKTEDVLLLENKLLVLKDKEEKEEERIRKSLTDKVNSSAKKIWRNIANIGKLDFLMAKAMLAVEIKAVKPNIVSDHIISIKKGRHPKIEEMLNKKGLRFTPISVSLKEGVTVITGANMGGKTVSLKLIGLLACMAQHGLFVPAEEMTLGLNGFIKSSIGDLQSIDRGLSTFGSEIKLIEEAIEIADKKGLILVDELARGTNPREGYAISKAIVQYLKEKPSITIMTTHYDNIGDMEGILHLQVVGLSNINFKELESRLYGLTSDRLEVINSLMNYELMEVEKVAQVPKDAINIARIMGLNPEIIKLAEKNLEQE
ncbi:MAG TPA: DNA mismatch repair protein MutS [Tissierellia bacterium]|nr:DNA mismatch repair protein MutS [Tissierellia bacterium]